jgi:SM-20-related protein
VIESLVIEDFLDPDEFVARLRAASSVEADVYGAAQAVDRRVRSTQKLAVDNELRDRVRSLLAAAQPRLAGHFGVTLERCEEPQFLRYLPGDFFVAHQDGNTPLIHDDSRHRRLSVVLFLNAEYGGGALVLHGRYPDWESRYVMPAQPGSLIAFRPETTHEVTPVTHGERYTIVSWYR